MDKVVFVIKAALFCLLLAVPLQVDSSEEDTCFNVPTEADEIAWNTYSHPSSFKNWFTDYYWLDESDWDEGWGWSSMDPAREFPKMWNAALMLEMIEEQGPAKRWESSLAVDYNNILSSPHLTDPLPTCRPAMRISEDRKVDAFYRDSLNQLVLFKYDVGIARPELTYDILSQTSANPDGRSLLFTGKPVILSGEGEPYIVACVPDQQFDNVIIFRQQGDGNWLAEFATSAAGESSFQIRNGQAVMSDDGIIHVAGINRNGRLVYYWLGASGAAMTELVVPAGPSYMLSTSMEGIFMSIADGQVDIFAVSRFSEPLYFCRLGTSWMLTNLSIFEDAPKVSPQTNVVGFRNNRGTFSVFFRNPIGELITYDSHLVTYCVLFDLCFTAGLTWTFDNLTRGATIDATPPPGSVWSVDVRMSSGPYVATTGNRRAIFGRGAGLFAATYDYLKYYHLSGTGWHAADLTLNLSFGINDLLKKNRVMTEPCIIAASDGLHVIATNAEDQVVEYAQIGTTPQFEVRYPLESARFPQNTLYQSPLSAVESPLNEIHVIGVETGGWWLTHSKLIIDGPWHAAIDYRRIASGSWTFTNYEPENESPSDRDAEAECVYAVFYRNTWIDLFCGTFDEQRGPASRAGLMVHEGMHEWNRDIFCSGGEHDSNEQDAFIMHSISAVAPGELLNFSGGHTSYQIEIEFLADFSQYAGEDVPLIILSEAHAMAQVQLSTRINNEVPWNLGIPRPL